MTGDFDKGQFEFVGAAQLLVHGFQAGVFLLQFGQQAPSFRHHVINVLQLV
ncbi:MAG: hypothetical protein KatS3mg105_0714 [Gemmatales bacterium]|nr:MAG: hypothetical protein KatS3mg105_0714 [Gemmatales bacterium]